MQQIAPRMAQMPQDHATTEKLLRDHMEPTSHTAPPYSSADAMQSTTAASMDRYSPESGALHADNTDDTSPDARKGYGKRELSTSKRAAQNRAAQRAFRQRKEGYIKKLEEQVRDYQVLSENYKSLQQENYTLRDYIINLQSRLIEAQGEVPPPPSNLDGLHPDQSNKLRQAPPTHQQHPPPQTHVHSPHQAPQGTLPRLSELSAMPAHPPKPTPDQTFYEHAAKHTQLHNKDMTPAQAALQGSSILQSPNGR